MSRDLFGTDGVRGLAGTYPLDNEGARRIGMAVAAHFAQPGERIVIGCDPRESSDEIVQAVAEGLSAAGAEAVVIGVIPTPGLAYITREHADLVAGVMVTASHNPYQYNGIKVFDGHGDKLPDDTEAALNRLITGGVEERQGGGVSQESPLAEYEDFLVSSAEGFRLEGLRIAVDTANGAASGTGQRVFERLGAHVTALSDRPDGQNINYRCGATDTAALRQSAQEQKLDVGIAVDGDADRLMLVDGQGRELTGDHIMYIVAVAGGLKGVVATSMTNLGVEQALETHGIKLERVAVGDRYVLEGLQRTGFTLGGEQSGHIIFPELLATGDALLAAVQTLKITAESGKSLAQWRDEVTILPQAIVNVPLDDKSRLEQPEVQACIAAAAERLAGRGRLIVRPSGTEPLLRVMVEAAGAESLAQSIADELKELVAA